MKCLFKDIRSALTPFLPLLCTYVYIKTCFGNLKIDANVLNRRDIPYTVKKGFRFSRPQPGCHLPNSPWPGII
jgi:hypothetical protein